MNHVDFRSFKSKIRNLKSKIEIASGKIRTSQSVNATVLPTACLNPMATYAWRSEPPALTWWVNC